jgi:coproporphyrinogen III oxidase-like Fe-S oxidoreductase
VSARRWWNVADLVQYSTLIEQRQLPVADEETVGEKELINERIFLGLRAGGLSLARPFGTSLRGFSASQQEIIRALVERGLAEIERDVLHLTPRGYVLCDEIAERLMVS